MYNSIGLPAGLSSSDSRHILPCSPRLLGSQAHLYQQPVTQTPHTQSLSEERLLITIHVYRRHTTCRLEFPSSFHRNLTPRNMSSSWQRSHHPESPPLLHLLTKNEVKDINIVHPNIHSKACSQHHLVFPNTHRLCQHVILDYIYA